MRPVVDDGSGDSIDVRDLRISADAVGSSTVVETVPTQCDSILHVDGARYGPCATGAPEEGDVSSSAPARSSISASLEFRHAGRARWEFICEVEGAGTNAVLSKS